MVTGAADSAANPPMGFSLVILLPMVCHDAPAA